MIWCEHCRLRENGCPLDPPHQATFCVECRPMDGRHTRLVQLDCAAQWRAAEDRRESEKRYRKLVSLLDAPAP